MCTAVNYKTKDHYFGRTLDIDCCYGEVIAITPRKFPFSFRKVENMSTHYAIIGVAKVLENYPLYFDGTNEKGLSMAGLNFVNNAVYYEEQSGMDNIAPFELIPWVLGQCESVDTARQLLEHTNLLDVSFNEKYPLAQLHWIISDSQSSITVEALKEGMKIYDNPMGILTNNPPFDIQMFNLNNYMGLSTNNPQNHFCNKVNLDIYSGGMGALGLPGDLSSMSRFIKASFTAYNSVSGEGEIESISQFFHILGSVCQQKGCVKGETGEYVTTQYTSCCNTDRGVYYYTTYENSQISAVDMNRENLDENQLITYSIIDKQQIRFQN